VSTASTPVTDSAALHAIRLIAAYLRDAVEHPHNAKVRRTSMQPVLHLNCEE
jgi:alcohol dehydrogenase class IV